MQLDQNNITHLSKSFFSADEISTLEKGENLIRVEPLYKGGKCYFVAKGGFHYAKMQEIVSWD